MKLSVKKGATSRSWLIFIADSSSLTGAGRTGLVFNTSGLACYYARPRAAAVAVTLASQSVGGAYASGGFVEIDATNMPGWYRFDPPDAALADGDVDSVGFHFKGAANMAPLPLEVQLGVDLSDARHQDMVDACVRGTAQGGGTNYVDLPAAASATDNFYAGNGVGCWVMIVGNTGAGQGRKGIAYTGSSRRLTVAKDWVTPPDSTSKIIVIPEGVPIFDATNPVIADARRVNNDATAGQQLQRGALGIMSGQAVAGTLSTTQMTTNLTLAHPDLLKDRSVIWRTGTLAGCSKRITGSTTGGLLSYEQTPVPPGSGDAFDVV